MSLLCEISADSGFTPGRTMCQCTDTCSFLHFKLTVISAQSTLLVPDAPIPCLLASSRFGFGFLYTEFVSPPISGLSFCSMVGSTFFSRVSPPKIIVEILPAFSLEIINTRRSNSHIEILIILQARRTWHEDK